MASSSFFFSGLPTNAKSTSDYMEGLFDLDEVRRANASSSASNSGRKRYGKNFSPVALKNRIEVLQSESKK
jgi:hypothetical protein